MPPVRRVRACSTRYRLLTKVGKASRLTSSIARTAVPSIAEGKARRLTYLGPWPDDQSLRRNSGRMLGLSKRQRVEWLRTEIPHRGLELQEGALAIQAPTIAHQATVGADHTMARNNDRNRVLAVGQSNRARTAANFLRLDLVRDGFTVRDISQLIPSADLKLGSIE